MRYKFNVQKSILIAGLMATSYAQACYYQQSTNSTCAPSGSTIDNFGWADGTPAYVIATSDFIMDSYNTHSTGYVGFTRKYCGGPAKITDRTTHVNNINYWEVGSANTLGSSPLNGTWGDVISTTTCP
jgi:hypothetical protein